MNIRRLIAVALLVGCPACEPSPASPVAVAPSAPVAPAPVPALPVSLVPDIDLRESNVAEVHGQRVGFDGVAEGLAWPSLDRALGPRPAGTTVVVQADRSIRVADMLRASWTLRDHDVRIQTKDHEGVVRAVELRTRPAARAPALGCHLAVFVRADGALRIAAPGGPREVGGDQPAESLARSLEAERESCAIKYIAFGAESDDSPWGPVFDVLVSVDRSKSAGDARYVLAQAMNQTSGARSQSQTR